MASIKKNIKIEGSGGKKKADALFDSGATYSCIQPELAEKLGMIDAMPQPISLGTAQEGKEVTAESRVILNFYINDYRFSDEFILIPDLSEEVIIGATTMQKWRMKLDFEHDDVIIDPRVTKLRLLYLQNSSDFEEKEENENKKDKAVCNHCGNDTWRVYCTIIIDDARLYCSKCGKFWCG